MGLTSAGTTLSITHGDAMTVQRPLEADDARRAVSDVQAALAWNRVYQAIHAISAHRPESGEDFDRADPKAIAAALSTAQWYQAEAPGCVPDDVFLMPDGGLMIEWGDPSGTVLRADFAPGGKSQLVITYADGREAEFVEFVPPHDHRRHPVGSQEKAHDALAGLGQRYAAFEPVTNAAWFIPATTSRKVKTEWCGPDFSLAW